MPILNLSPAMTKWFSGMIGATIRCKEVFSLWLWILTESGGYAIGLIMKAIERVVFAEFTCILALGMLKGSLLSLNSSIFNSCIWLCPEELLII